MTQDELVRSLLGLATEGVSNPADAFRLGDVSGATIRPVEWLWEGYLLKSNLTLVDAKGGSGKTRFFLAVAAALSVGILPFGVDGRPVAIDPGRSLLFSSEDDEGDIREVFEQLGGNSKMLTVWDPAKMGTFVLDDNGLADLEKYIRVNDYKMFCFDPILEYLPRDVKSQSDNIGITKVLAGLRVVARETGAAGVQIRHFSAASIGKEVSTMGAGGEAWRNASRGQFVLFPHPENDPKMFRVLIVPSRASMRTTVAPPFEMVIENGRQSFVAPQGVDIDPYANRYESVKRMFNIDAEDEGPKNKRGPGANQGIGAERFILDSITLQPRFWATLKEEAIADGMTERTFYRAKKSLIDQGKIREVDGFIETLVDPFAD